MATITANNSGAVVIDANVLIAIYAREQNKLKLAEIAVNDYAGRNWQFYAPGVIVSEVLYILCGKLQSAVLTQADYAKAIQDFADQMTVILPPPHGDGALILRAAELCQGYGCSHSADGIYIALAEQLSQQGATELLTFDQGMVNQAAKNAPAVKVNVLIP